MLSVVDTTAEWFYSVHPERYVPALKDQDPDTGDEITVFEGTACLQYLAERYDTAGEWKGRTLSEKAAVLTWTAYQTAGLGCVDSSSSKRSSAHLFRPTAKYWLYFLKGYPNRQSPEPLPKTVAK